MDKKKSIIIIIVGLLITLMIGGIFGYHVKECPKIASTGVDTVYVQRPRDTVRIRDTVFTVTQRIVTHVIHDTLWKKDSLIRDTMNCYEFEQKERDSAYVKVQICSDSLPKKKPIDLQAYFTYVPPITKVEVITKTFTIEKPAKFWDWKTYTLAAIILMASGYAIANH